MAFLIEALSGLPAAAVDVPPNGGASYLFSACRDTGGAVSPLGPRPVAARRTLASPLPHRPRPRRVALRPHRIVHKAHPVRRLVHRPRPLLHRATAAHRVRHARPAHVPSRAPARRVFRKATFASPLCVDRTPVINALLNDLGVPQFQPVALPEQPGALPVEQLAALPNGATPVGGSGELIGQPLIPLVPGSPIGGGGGGGGVVIVAVPEPASWAMLLIGFGLVGTALRSRRRTRRVA